MRRYNIIILCNHLAFALWTFYQNNGAFIVSILHTLYIVVSYGIQIRRPYNITIYILYAQDMNNVQYTICVCTADRAQCIWRDHRNNNNIHSLHELRDAIL